jgi:hypothetical protein
MTTAQSLRSVIAHLATSRRQVDDALTIYAAGSMEAWSPDSRALVVRVDDAGHAASRLPPDFQYFLEAFIALEVLEPMLERTPDATVDELSWAVIHYARYDA